jgi:hypothetical protein
MVRIQAMGLVATFKRVTFEKTGSSRTVFVCLSDSSLLR